MLLYLLLLLNFITQEFNKSFVPVGVQPAAAAAAGAGPARPQEAGPPRRARAHAEEPEGPGARPGRELQQRPERRGGRGGAEAAHGGAQRPGHAAQQRQHHEEAAAAAPADT